MEESKHEYVTKEIDGIGEVRARVGTSTAELAGAAAYWNKKATSAFREGFLSATAFWSTVLTVVYLSYHYFWS